MTILKIAMILGTAFLTGCCDPRQQPPNCKSVLTFKPPVDVRAYVPLDCGASQLFFEDSSGQGLYLYNLPFRADLVLSTSGCVSKPDMNRSVMLAEQHELAIALHIALRRFAERQSDTRSLSRIRAQTDFTKLTNREQILWGVMSFAENLEKMKEAANQASQAIGTPGAPQPER